MRKMTDICLISRPGYFGKKRKEIEATLNEKYPKWEECWQIKNYILDFDEAVMLYDNAYYEHIKKSGPNWIITFGECYDSHRSNISCGINHDKTACPRHIQDVSVRRSLIKLGIYFSKYKGSDEKLYDENELLHIRGSDTNGHTLMPGNVPFHIPEIILETENVKDWCRSGSVEHFWQANKVIITT